jgi:hypothetical protein
MGWHKMGIKNPWAFVTETGSKRVTAYGVGKRRSLYGGRRIGKVLYSPHKPGQRKPMRHVLRDGTAYFSYMSASDEHAAGPGESLSHRLFKEVVAGLSKTRLVLNGGRGEYALTITRGEIEKEIVHPGGSYFADAYVQFESNGELGQKWSGELYIEVHKTHQVPEEKIDQLRKMRVPVVEVKLPEFAEYRCADDRTTDELEEWHRQRLKRIFEGTTGFLMATVLSDPSSVEYLEKKLGETRRALNEAKQQAVNAASALEDANGREQQLSSRVAELDRSNSGQHRQVSEMESQLRSSKANEKHLAGELQAKEALLNETSRNVKKLQVATAVAGLLIGSFVLFEMVELAKAWFQ